MVHVQGLSLKVFSMSWKLMEVNVHHKHNISDIPDFFAEASFFFFFFEKYLKILKLALVKIQKLFDESIL